MEKIACNLKNDNLYEQDKLDTITKKYENMTQEWIFFIDKNWDLFEFSILIDWKKELIWYILFNECKEYFEVYEFVSIHFHNYNYSDKLFDVLNYSKKDFLNNKTYLENKEKFNYLWVYMLYYIINKAKNKWYNLVKIVEVEDNACRFYKKAWESFAKLWIIQKYNLPKYEKTRPGCYYINQQKNINLEL